MKKIQRQNSVHLGLAWALTGMLLTAAVPGISTQFKPKGSTNQPTIITSDSLEYNSQQGVAVYRGKVKVVDPGIDLKCEVLTVTFSKQPKKGKSPKAAPSKVAPPKSAPAPLPVRPMMGVGGKIDTIVAEYNVEIINKKDKTRATGKKAIYTYKTEIIVLTGSPVLYTEQGVLAGEVIELDRRTNNLTARRAKVNVSPDSPKKKSPAVPSGKKEVPRR